MARRCPIGQCGFLFVSPTNSCVDFLLHATRLLALSFCWRFWQSQLGTKFKRKLAMMQLCSKIFQGILNWIVLSGQYDLCRAFVREDSFFFLCFSQWNVSKWIRNDLFILLFPNWHLNMNSPHPKLISVLVWLQIWKVLLFWYDWPFKNCRHGHCRLRDELYTEGGGDCGCSQSCGCCTFFCFKTLLEAARMINYICINNINIITSNEIDLSWIFLLGRFNLYHSHGEKLTFCPCPTNISRTSGKVHPFLRPGAVPTLGLYSFYWHRRQAPHFWGVFGDSHAISTARLFAYSFSMFLLEAEEWSWRFMVERADPEKSSILWMPCL